MLPEGGERIPKIRNTDMTYPGEEYPSPWELAIELDLVKIVRDLIITSSGRGKREIFKYFLLIFFTIWSSPYWFSFPTQ